MKHPRKSRSTTVPASSRSQGASDGQDSEAERKAWSQFEGAIDLILKRSGPERAQSNNEKERQGRRGRGS
jgi:hypothetical protein